jgi:5,10-methylenetetrahydromethanopterin reductase
VTVANLEISCGFAPGPDTPEQVRIAEDLGYERAWFFDSPALYRDIWVTMALAAERTERITLGTAVLVPGLRHPLTQASAIATLEGLAPGRIVVAIGTGFTGRMALGQKAMTWADTRTYIAQVKGLLEGEAMVIDGAVVKMIPPDGFLPDRPIEVPIVVAANGPKGFDVAKELGDGVMTVVGSNPDFDWCSLLAFGTVLDPGESPESERVYAAAGPAVTVVYHGMYESDPAVLDAFPGGPEWRAEIDQLPEHLRHLAIHEDHCVAVTDRDRPLLSGDGILGFTMTGEAPALRERLAAVAAAGTSEILYAPIGPDIPRELERFMEMAKG